jgi:putative ABC transport system permease protein
MAAGKSMMLITRLSLANLKKKKGVALTLIIFMLLATALLNTGLTLVNKMESIYEQKEKEINGAQFIAMSGANTYKTDFEEFLLGDSRIALAEKEEVIFMPTTKNNRNSLELGSVLFSLDNAREIAPLIPIENDTTIPRDKAIYVPIMLKSYNLSVGDAYDITYKGKTYSFIVAGFFETTYYGTVSSGYLKYFLPAESYEALYSDIGRAIILSARFKTADNDISSVSEAFTDEFKNAADKLYNTENPFLSYLNSATIKADYMSFISIIGAILIAFSLVVCIIIMTVIYNRVAESIDECMQNIGVLGSLGYTTKQIMTSFVLEFVLLSIAGGVSGIILSYVIAPILSDYLLYYGIIWNSGIHLSADFLCFGILVISICCTAFLGALRIIKLPPVRALHKGSNNHQFRKNRCPLHKGIGSIHFRLGLKDIFSNVKSNASFTLIVAGGLFAIGLGMVMYMNFAIDSSALFKMTGFEMSDLQISVTSHTDTKEFSEELLAMEEVRKTNLSDLTTARLENHEVQVTVSDNFDAMETLSTYEGTLPLYENEIAITGVMSMKIHKGIGDTVKVTAGGRTQAYCITGIYQSSNNGGYMTILPLSGIRKIRPLYKIGQIDIYLNEGVEKELFKEKLRSIYKVAVKEGQETEETESNTGTSENKKYANAAKTADEKIAKLLADYGVNSISYTVMLNGEIILSGDSSAYKINEITDLNDYARGQLDSMGSMISGLVTIIIVIIFLIIGGILSITIKTMIRKKSSEYGIYKAMGYTTKDLVKQLSLNFVITSFIGTILGSIVTILFSNKILQLLFIKMGFTRLTLSVNFTAILILAGCMMLFIYLLALIKAYKIKHITAYDLLTE